MSKYVEYTWTHWCISSLNTFYQPLNIGRCNSDVAVHLIKTCICFCYLIKTCVCLCYLIKTCICFCYLIKTCVCLCYLINTCICFCYLIKTCICFCSRKINYYNTNSKGKSAIVLPYVVLRCLSAVVLTCHI